MLVPPKLGFGLRLRNVSGGVIVSAVIHGDSRLYRSALSISKRRPNRARSLDQNKKLYRVNLVTVMNLLGRNQPGMNHLNPVRYQQHMPQGKLL